MYKKASGILFLCNILFLLLIFSVKGLGRIYRDADLLGDERVNEKNIYEKEYERLRALGMVRRSASGERIVDLHTIEKEPILNIDEKEKEILLKIVEAEAEGEDEDGKVMVANVVINRVLSDAFPNSVSKVVYQKNDGVTQFSPVANGRMNHVTISEDTKRAVDRALAGEDLTAGALYFASRELADPKNMNWFDDRCEKLLQHGGHEFFK